MPSQRLPHIGVRWPEARLVRVSAELRHGVAVPTRWPAMLDGILATAARRQRLGAHYGSIVDHHLEDLPLARWEQHCGSRWCWAATAAELPDEAAEDVRWWHKRSLDSLRAEIMVDKLPANTDVGAIKAWRMPRVITIVGRLHWWACGDPAGIESLLRTVHQIGDGRSSGEGVVTGWTVEDHGTADRESRQRIVATTDGHPARPWPARAAEGLGFTGADVVEHTVRPPYWRAPQTTLADGGFARVLPEVIAPWATKCAA